MTTAWQWLAPGMCGSELHRGDRMSREEFHRAYESTPPQFRAELIAGVVFIASPVPRSHATSCVVAQSLFAGYQAHTPGVEGGVRTTILLGGQSEPEPDLFLRILPGFGGQSQTTDDDYVLGPPELLTEIAHSSRSIDLHAKRDDYQRYGVLEYLVLCLREKQLRWFDLRNDRELQPENDGIYRIRCFPGLWIDAAAVLAKNYRRMMSVLEQGLTSPEHAAFVQRLAAVKAGQAAG